MNRSLAPDILMTALSAGKPTYGGWCILPTSFSAEVLGQRGFDWVALDWQHGFMDAETSATMMQAIALAGAAPLVRVGYNDPMVIMKALDMGAFGVIVPMVNNREEAEDAVAACRYPPAGRRSFGPVRNSAAIGTDPMLANERVLCFAMVETADGLLNVDEICSTPGLNGIYIGPDDLRLSLGVPHSETGPAVERVLQTCKREGRIAGIHASDGQSARRFAERGFGLIGIASDADFLALAADQALTTARGEPGNAVGATEERVVRSVVWSGL
jgi:4-hydroxy-2-oxoheptanedioate aldolase